MTREGVQLTQEGEIPNQIFNLKRRVDVGFSEGSLLTDVDTVEYNFQLDTRLKMIFVLKGRLKGVVHEPKKKSFVLIDHQHNLVLASEKIKWEVGSDDNDIVCLEIGFSFLAKYLPSDHPGLNKLRKGIEESELAIFSSQNLHITPEIIAILNSLKTSTHSGFCERLFLESKVLELLMFQASQFEQLRFSNPSARLKEEEMNKMQAVKNILLTNVNTQIPLRALAHMVGTNEFNLKRNFKIAFGNTVYGYLNNYKMEFAKTMLLENNFTIAEIATKIGYKYATHFSSAFKKYYGYLPTKLKSTKLSLLLFTEEFSMLMESLLVTAKVI